MISIDIFGGLAPLVQLVLVVGFFIMIFLIACNRNAAINLATFLRHIYAIYLLHRTYKQRSAEEDTTISKKGMEHILDDLNT